MYFYSWNLTFLSWCTINRLSCSWQCVVRRSWDVPKYTYQAPASQHVSTSPGLRSHGEEELEVTHEVSFGAGPFEHLAAHHQTRGQTGPELGQLFTSPGSPCSLKTGCPVNGHWPSQQEQGTALTSALEGSCNAPCTVFPPREPCGAIAANSSGSASSTCSSLVTWWSIHCACSDRTAPTGVKNEQKNNCARPRTRESSCLRCSTEWGALCVALSTLQNPGWVKTPEYLVAWYIENRVNTIEA